jgi:hypothetical protein
MRNSIATATGAADRPSTDRRSIGRARPHPAEMTVILLRDLAIAELADPGRRNPAAIG